jgi:hypothetical protein
MLGKTILTDCHTKILKNNWQPKLSKVKQQGYVESEYAHESSFALLFAA